MAEDRVAEALRRIAERDTAGIAGHPWAEEVPRLFQALCGVLERHVDSGDGFCACCCFSWPCRDVRAIAEALDA